MSRFWKITLGVTAAVGAVAICACCPAATAAVGKAAMLAAPSVCEIIDLEAVGPSNNLS